MTVKEALIQAREKLNGLRVPAGLIREIGAPIIEAADLITACIDTMEAGEASKKEAEDA